MPEQRYMVYAEFFRNGKWETYKPPQTVIITFYPAEQAWELREGTKVIFTSETSEFWNWDGEGVFTQIIFRNQAGGEIDKVRLNLDEKAYDLYDAANEQNTPAQFYLTPPETAIAESAEAAAGGSGAGLIAAILAIAGIGLYAASRNGKKKAGRRGRR